MIELRADGSREGAPKLARIYKMAGDGKLWYASGSVELESDWKPYIETYAGFRGFVTEFFPVEELKAKLAEFNAVGFTTEEKERELAAHLKSVFMVARATAEKAAHAYFAACPVGPERIWASEVYENIRNATRV